MYNYHRGEVSPINIISNRPKFRSDDEHNRDKSIDYQLVICYASFYSHHFLHLNCNLPITDAESVSTLATVILNIEFSILIGLQISSSVTFINMSHTQ